ncbi:MAG: RNA polymerase sigma-70 factor (ECF subfamily) [Myxococcota bacterium]|jgi:RNA polymerase sigma-70 factor (ECF subfamily)
MSTAILNTDADKNTLDLVARLAARDVRALEQFHREYRDGIMGLARRITGNEWDAEEVLQDVVWTVYRKADSFRGEAHFRRWVNRVTHNVCLMLLRKRKRVPQPMDDQALSAIMGAVRDADIGTRTEEVVEGRATLRRISECLGAQDSVNQRLFQLMDMEGADKEGAADELGLSIPAIKARLHRVRHALKSAALAN